MKLEMEKIRFEKYYLVSYLSAIDKYVMVCVVSRIAWYNRYYEITKKSMNLLDLS